MARNIAFKNNVDQGDFVSYFDWKLCGAINLYIEPMDMLLCWGLLHKIRKNAFLDFVKIVPVMKKMDIHTVEQPDIDPKYLLKKVNESMINHKHVKIFTAYFLDGLKSCEIAKQFNMPENTVKTHINRIRSFLNLRYGSIYNELIAA